MTVRRRKSSPDLRPGLYLLDVNRAMEKLLCGRLLGTCKVCGREFRVHPDRAQWSTSIETFLRHPLEHGAGQEYKAVVEAVLLDVRNGHVPFGQEKIAELIEENLDTLADSGVLTRVRGED